MEAVYSKIKDMLKMAESLSNDTLFNYDSFRRFMEEHRHLDTLDMASYTQPSDNRAFNYYMPIDDDDFDSPF